MENEIKLIQERGKRDVLTAQAREEARSRGNIKIERQNSDIHKETRTHEAELKKMEKLELQKKKFDFIRNYSINLFEMVSDPSKIRNILLGTTGLFFGYFATKVF